MSPLVLFDTKFLYKLVKLQLLRLSSSSLPLQLAKFSFETLHFLAATQNLVECIFQQKLLFKYHKIPGVAFSREPTSPPRNLRVRSRIPESGCIRRIYLVPITDPPHVNIRKGEHMRTTLLPPQIWKYLLKGLRGYLRHLIKTINKREWVNVVLCVMWWSKRTWNDLCYSSIRNVIIKSFALLFLSFSQRLLLEN